MKTLYITVGVSGSGKTTWALEKAKTDLIGAIICRDDLRAVVLANKKNRSVSDFRWDDWKWKWEPEVDALRDIQIEEALSKNANVILADTNLSSKNYEDVRRRFLSAGYNVEFVYFPLTWDEAIKRNAARKNGVSYSVLQQQFQKWNSLFPTFAPFVNDGLRDAIVVDIDGTVAQMTGRGPYDWHKVGQDKPIYHIVDLVKALHEAGYDIVFLSGRDGCCRDETILWLDQVFEDWNVFDYRLFMRAAGDQRKDDIVKRELIELIKPQNKVKMVIDDRPQVCRMWRQIGLNVLQVADPYKEF